MIRVLVQVWGPMEGSGANYNWITIGAIDNPPSIDIDALQPRIRDIVQHSAYHSPARMVRLAFQENGKTYMKLMLS